MESSKELKLIPKTENYIKYMLNVITKLPRTEKFNIGNEYKNTMYKMLEEIVLLTKVSKEQRLDILNKIDAYTNIQRIFLRIMCENRWLDKKQFLYCISLIDEIGKIVGALIKTYVTYAKK